MRKPTARATTVRDSLRVELRGPPRTAAELSARVAIPEKDVAAHLDHLDRSARQQGERLVITPAECEACHYVFEDRRRFTKPSRCPVCRKTHIQAPAFRLVADGSTKAPKA